MSDPDKRDEEYPDAAGYPDGSGTLDEGTGGFEVAEEEESVQTDGVAASGDDETRAVVASDGDPADPDEEGLANDVMGSGPEDMDAHGGHLGGTAAGGGEVPD